MGTQHPDSASRYVSVQEEPDEIIECVREYGCDEYKPDYEGKATPYHQNAFVVTKLFEETDLIPGKDVFITPRIPSATQENAFRQIMAIMSVAEANWKALEYTDTQAIVEIVHPMTQDVLELVNAQERIMSVTELAKKEFNFKMDIPRIIPLLEEVPSHFIAKEMMKEYISKSKEKLSIECDRFRVFIGKSDSALFFGHVASALSCKYAISSVHELERELNEKIGIIFGAGALPFRGHVTLENAENVLKEYSGIDTITLQSGLRYDHGIKRARKFVKIAKNRLPTKAQLYSQEEKEEITNIVAIFAKNYIETLYHLVGVVKKVADLLPNQRDRLARGGSIGYFRDASNIVDFSRRCRDDIKNELLKIHIKETLGLPRAIKFTGALYSIGIPPEIIGTGRGLREIKEKLGDSMLERIFTTYYPSLKADLSFSTRFLNLNVSREFLSGKAFMQVEKDIEILSEFFEMEAEKSREQSTYLALMEMTKPYILHLANNSKQILGDEPLHLTKRALLELGKIRKSLG